MNRGSLGEGEGGGVPIILEHLFCDFYHFRHFKRAGRNNSVPKPTTFSEANTKKFYAILLHFAKCRNLHFPKY